MIVCFLSGPERPTIAFKSSDSASHCGVCWATIEKGEYYTLAPLLKKKIKVCSCCQPFYQVHGWCNASPVLYQTEPIELDIAEIPTRRMCAVRRWCMPPRPAPVPARAEKVTDAYDRHALAEAIKSVLRRFAIA